MSKLKKEFIVDIDIAIIEIFFEEIVATWVNHHQENTSTFTKALSNVVLGVSDGMLFDKLFAQKGVESYNHNITVKIPMNTWTFGGSMSITISYSEDGKTKVNISGQTQGLLGGTLTKNVEGITEYIKKIVPECIKIYQDRYKGKGKNTVVSHTSEINELFNLYNNGAITEDEFNKLKAKLIEC